MTSNEEIHFECTYILKRRFLKSLQEPDPCTHTTKKPKKGYNVEQFTRRKELLG